MARWAKQYNKRKTAANTVLERMGKRESKKDKEKSGSTSVNTVNSISKEKYFKLHSGGELKSIEELALMIDKLSDEDLRYHVTAEKNDFANWMRDVFEESELAEEFTHTADKKESQILLLKHVVSS